MTMTSDQVSDKLQYLLGTLRDGEKGFADAAEHASDASLKSLFQSRVAQRTEMAQAIERELSKYGEVGKQGGSVGAALHRTWLGVRDAISGRGDKAVVAESARGEDVAADNYQDVLKETDLPSDVRAVIEGQFAKIKASQVEMQALKAQWDARS
jgi:uncharacterized protein (TIGR02284 family)